MSTVSHSEQDDEALQAELDDIREQMGSEYEKIRMTSLLRLQELKTMSPAILEMVETLSADSSREVRTAARALLKSHGQDVTSKDQRRQSRVQKQHKGNIILALVSFGSASTGILATIFTLISYYTMKKFPFPEPAAVLFWVNAILTVPYMILGGLLLFPGQTQRSIASGYALFSLIGSLAAILGVQPLYNHFWAVQFTIEKQASYSAFLSPERVVIMLLPVILGQAMLLYFTSSLSIKESLDGQAGAQSPGSEAIDT